MSPDTNYRSPSKFIYPQCIQNPNKSPQILSIHTTIPKIISTSLCMLFHLSLWKFLHQCLKYWILLICILKPLFIHHLSLNPNNISTFSTMLVYVSIRKWESKSEKSFNNKIAVPSDSCGFYLSTIIPVKRPNLHLFIYSISETKATKQIDRFICVYKYMWGKRTHCSWLSIIIVSFYEA